jgi:hypothetical protein
MPANGIAAVAGLRRSMKCQRQHQPPGEAFFLADRLLEAVEYSAHVCTRQTDELVRTQCILRRIRRHRTSHNSG